MCTSFLWCHMQSLSWMQIHIKCSSMLTAQGMSLNDSDPLWLIGQKLFARQTSISQHGSCLQCKDTLQDWCPRSNPKKQVGWWSTLNRHAVRYCNFPTIWPLHLCLNSSIDGNPKKLFPILHLLVAVSSSCQALSCIYGEILSQEVGGTNRWFD